MEPLNAPALSWTKASFFRREGARVHCTLCPHACTLAAGEYGFCQVRRERDGGMETATFAAAIRHWDAVERKPLYHYRPGSQVYTLAAPGCSFRCLYCQNHRLSQYGRSPQASWQAQQVDPVQVIELAAAQGAAVGLSYSEPSLAAELTLALATAARHRGVDLLWKSNGFLMPDALACLAPHLAAVNIDLKSLNDKRHRSLTGAPVAPIVEVIRYFYKVGTWLEISTPLIPGINTGRAELRQIAQTIAEISLDIPWHLVRFSPEYRMKRLPPTAEAMFQTALQVGRELGLRYIYRERDREAAGRTTFCSACGLALVVREIGGLLDNVLLQGACPACQTPLPGRW